MILTRTPYRISFFGGGTDYPAFYREHRGTVLSATINLYSHIVCRFLPPFFGHRYRIRYYKSEYVDMLDDIQHPSVRESLRCLNIYDGIEMVHTGDIPAMSGIGSSSAFTVGFLMALKTLVGQPATKKEIAEKAIFIEQEMNCEHVGSQDQIAAAFGGLNRIDFYDDQEFTVTPIQLEPQRIQLLNDSLLLVFTGLQREADTVAKEQIKRTDMNLLALKHMRDMVDTGIDILKSNCDLSEFGLLLHDAWKLKQSLSPLITNNRIDEIYNRAIRSGAVGGKLCGAGNGGFFLFFTPPEKKREVLNSLNGHLHVPFRFENLGAHTIFNSGNGEGKWVRN